MGDTYKNICKFETVFTLKDSAVGTDLEIFMGNEWVCTGFTRTIARPDLLLVMEPLQEHPYGVAFGMAPNGLHMYVVDDTVLKKYFDILPNRNYIKEQQEINRGMKQ